jgi:serine/threonine protein kinase
MLVRDPGVELLAGERPQVEPGSWLPTLLARKVAAGENGSFTQGYRNYVGQLVVGAWRWLPDHEIGIALEQDYHSSYAMVRSTRGAIYLMSGLFSVALIGFLTAVAVGERRQRLRDVSEVGPYQIQELLGEGGMGRVYLAEHALLCRQSAIKVLTKGDTDLSIISRFEREVQLASQLTHPNTISIFDFGRSRDGVFYYAMEYIHGAHLGQLVEYVGPLPPGRCIYILRQLCRALLEAHHAGVVHRDIKPQNIMVCNRGGEPDFVKLFDYGLVKAFAPGVSPNQSQTKVVVGTPRFMAPERLNSPWLADPRVDVYSVGALAYYLLTAQLPPLVTAGEDHEQEQPGVETLDLPPAVVEFGGLLSVCMSVEPASRPSNMTSVLRELDGLAKKFPWSREDSELWWSKNEEKLLRLVRSKRLRLKPDGDRFWKK